MFFCYFSNQQGVELTVVKPSKHRDPKHFYIPKAVNNVSMFNLFHKGLSGPASFLYSIKYFQCQIFLHRLLTLFAVNNVAHHGMRTSSATGNIKDGSVPFRCTSSRVPCCVSKCILLHLYLLFWAHKCISTETYMAKYCTQNGQKGDCGTLLNLNSRHIAYVAEWAGP